MSIKVYIVRHGQTILNLYNRMQGWCDAPLTVAGMDDATAAGKALADIHFDYAYSSDLPRAKRTAELVLDQLTTGQRPVLRISTLFREQSMGYLEGEDGGHAAEIITGKPFASFGEFAKTMPMSKVRDLMAAQDPHHIAENNHDFLHRINMGIKQLSELPDGSTVLLVSHGLVIRSLMEEFAAPGLYDPGHAPENGTIQLMEINNSQPTVKFYNRHSLPADD
ncbi:MAG: histidine phosphatase family protein [[Lactobacillus] timonensis]|jgi:probable phosphoglycerate mutase|uniref:histidine phosphatase family protein n=1 Tax=[Lactobacillus] timonensis TaxID=1970790 RepID=UPI002355A450|nr:histidine phosphatase family protein [[Lactobacillus] timonensis]MCI1926483.1 histidine phosphatase family protein [[Lactobacillus] timonensis]MCI1957884.1 histidine phosphatase family protein [[Lactobacillus] timonensis]MCI1970881.1 histidine phosphatase family protein [[Lactobacillus] timonensis]MCI2007044.1 histidine phosphatase family protein [[Lactobacillus] timonensis]